MAHILGGGCLTPEQEEALALIGLDPNQAVDYSCVAGQVNTCGISAEELILTYPLYDPLAGRNLRAWGKIDLSWSFESEDSDVRWGSASYNKEFGYTTGDKVVNIEQDGHLLVVYEATEDIPIPVGVFDPSKWSEICRIKVAEPVGLPSYSELLSLYPYYDLSLLKEQWGEFESAWGNELTSPSSDQWSKASIRKDFFHRQGDVVLYDTRCGDNTCVYVALQDMPAQEDLVTDGPPSPIYWQRMYCVDNGKPNLCGKTIKCGPGRQLVSLSTDPDDLVCVPVESTVGIGPVIR